MLVKSPATRNWMTQHLEARGREKAGQLGAHECKNRSEKAAVWLLHLPSVSRNRPCLTGHTPSLEFPLLKQKCFRYPQHGPQRLCTALTLVCFFSVA